MVKYSISWKVGQVPKGREQQEGDVIRASFVGTEEEIKVKAKELAEKGVLIDGIAQVKE